MIEDSAQGVTNAKAAYEARPWLKHYPSHVGPEITPQFTNGLDMFLKTVQDLPEQAAIHYFDQTMSYGELDRKSSALAAALKERGVTHGDRIALYLQNIPQFLIGLYGAWKVGAIVVLCNPMLKHHELEYHLTDSGAKGLICLESLYETVARDTVGNTKVEFVITTNELDFAGEGPSPALLASSKKQRFEGPLDSHDVVIGVAPFFHVTGLIAHVAVAALVGMPTIMFYRFEAAEMLRLIEKWHGSFTVASITVFIALLAHPDIKTRDLSSMKKIYSGGAPVSSATVESFQEATGVYIHNVYGLTESTNGCLLVPLGVHAPVDPDSGALSVGLPAPNTICRVVDITTGQDLPVGEVGELIIKGPEIVAGYWEKPEETTNAIRDGYLYTGDVTRMDEDGWFYVVDRKKDLIIVSGYKVWPRDVEDVLYQHPAVHQAAVVGVPDPYRGETIIAYVALKSGYEGTVTPEELIEFCKQRLANYKYPRKIEIMEELPQTQTGKFLRRELRDKAQH